MFRWRTQKTIGSDVPNLMKDAPNFVNDVPNLVILKACL